MIVSTIKVDLPEALVRRTRAQAQLDGERGPRPIIEKALNEYFARRGSAAAPAPARRRGRPRKTEEAA